MARDMFKVMPEQFQQTLEFQRSLLEVLELIDRASRETNTVLHSYYTEEAMQATRDHIGRVQKWCPEQMPAEEEKAELLSDWQVEEDLHDDAF